MSWNVSNSDGVQKATAFCCGHRFFFSYDNVVPIPVEATPVKPPVSGGWVAIALAILIPLVSILGSDE
jgi:hypothetical protein